MSEKQYRELGPDEVIQEGDEYSNDGLAPWVACIYSIGSRAGDGLCSPKIKLRRLIPTPTPTPPDLEKEKPKCGFISAPTGEQLQPSEAEKAVFQRLALWQEQSKHAHFETGKKECPHCASELSQLRAENERLKKLLESK